MANLTRTERIKKLGNAIKRYRGEYRPGLQVAGKPIKWLTSPDPAAASDIVRWMSLLNFTLSDQLTALSRIRELKNHDEFGEFMKSIQ